MRRGSIPYYGLGTEIAAVKRPQCKDRGQDSGRAKPSTEAPRG